MSDAIKTLVIFLFNLSVGGRSGWWSLIEEKIEKNGHCCIISAEMTLATRNYLHDHGLEFIDLATAVEQSELSGTVIGALVGESTNKVYIVAKHGAMNTEKFWDNLEAQQKFDFINPCVNAQDLDRNKKFFSELGLQTKKEENGHVVMGER